MTWTTIAPGGATQPVTLVLFAATALVLAYAVGLLYRVAQLRRMRVPRERWKNIPIPTEMCESIEAFLKDHPEIGIQSVAEFVRVAEAEGLEEERVYRRRYRDAHGRLEQP